VLLITLLAAIAFHRTPTQCALVDVIVDATVTDQQLIGCGESFTDKTLWNLDRSDGVEDGVFARRTTGRGSVVYVIDTGVDASHQEFAGRHIDGIDILGPQKCGDGLDDATHPCPYHDEFLAFATHGTAVASVIAGNTAGVAPDASLVSVRAFAMNANSGSEPFIRALDAILEHAQRASIRTAIVNMSGAITLATANDPYREEFERKMRRMIDGASGTRFLFVTVAGNAGVCSGNNDVFIYPGTAGQTIDGLITVGGIARDGGVWSRSCYGRGVEILAPAERILTASISAPDHYLGTVMMGGVRDAASGTSYATAYVSGIAARMLEENPDWTPADIERMIKAKAVDGVAVLIEAAPPARRRTVR
jgi:subtilisin family serine protease